jgi:hypothetical protein
VPCWSICRVLFLSKHSALIQVEWLAALRPSAFLSLDGLDNTADVIALDELLPEPSQIVRGDQSRS